MYNVAEYVNAYVYVRARKGRSRAELKDGGINSMLLRVEPGRHSDETSFHGGALI